MEAGSPRSPWCRHTQVLVSSLFLVYRWPPSHLVLTGWREEALMSLPLLKRALIPSGGTTPMTFCKFNYHPKNPPLQIPSPWRLERHHMNSGRTQTLSPSQRDCFHISSVLLHYLMCTYSLAFTTCFFFF